MAWSDHLLDVIFDELFPICRSISGPGLRDSLDVLARQMPLERRQVPTGSLCFLQEHHEHLSAYLEAGLVLTCLGGPRDRLSYKGSRRGDGLFDRVFAGLAAAGHDIEIRSFTPESGSDARQYCSPGFNFAVGVIDRCLDRVTGGREP
jgi:aminopeptidase-like protein